MSWLSQLGKDLGIRIDSHTLGNVLKNVSPVAALIPGVGPLAAAGIAAGASALGDLGRGKSPGIASALENAGLGYGASSLLGGLGGAAPAGAPGVQSAAGSVAPGATAGVTPPSTVTIGGVSLPAPSAAAMPAGPSWAQSLAGAGSPQGVLSRALSDAGSAAKGLGSFVEKNPTAAAMGLQGIGNLATAGARNRLANTQADQAEYDLESQKRRNQYLSQYLNQYGGLGGNFTPASNPYTGRAT